MNFTRRFALILLLLATPCLAATPTTLPTRKVRIPGTPVEIELVRIPAGKVELAGLRSGDATRVVEIKSVWFATAETTWEAFDEWVLGLHQPDRRMVAAEMDARTRPSSKPYEDPTRGWGHEGQPALSMTYHSAKTYCIWLTAITGRHFRLPTEAEWEYACRAGGPPLTNFDEKHLDAVAWHANNSPTDEFPDGRTHPVARKTANAWGLYDMLGNVAEWVDMGNAEVPSVKGGSFRSKRMEINSSDRLYERPRWHLRDPQEPQDRWWFSDAPFVGFRVVCDDDRPPTRPAGR